MANGWPWGSRKADHHIRLPETAEPLNTVSRPSELRISLACRPRRLPTRRMPPSALICPSRCYPTVIFDCWRRFGCRRLRSPVASAKTADDDDFRTPN